jgi:hypothetical protein
MMKRNSTRQKNKPGYNRDKDADYYFLLVPAIAVVVFVVVFMIL